MRVGDRRVGAAPAVARGARHRARAARPDVERAAPVAPGDRAAAGADRGDVELRRQDRVAADPALACVHLQQAARDHADVRGGAADVERDEVLVPVDGADVAPGDDARRGAGQQEVHGVVGGLADLGDAAVGLHDEDRAGDAGVAPALGEAVEVPARLRLEIGVRGGGREALELAELGDDLVRQGDLGVRVVLGDELTGAQLVARVQEREEEADADRLDACRLELEDRLDAALLVERRGDLARRDHALGHRLAVLALDERPALERDVLHQREVVRPLMAPDVDDVPEALGREHPRAPAVVLEQGVRRDRRPVQHEPDVGRIDPRDLADLARALHGAACRIVGGRRELVDDESLLQTAERDVRVRAADVHPQADHAAIVYTRMGVCLTFACRASSTTFAPP